MNKDAYGWCWSQKGRKPLGHMVAAFVCICFSVGMAKGEERSDTPNPSPQSEQLEPSRAETERLPWTTIKVREIRVTGSTVFSEMELAEVTRPYVARGELTAEDLDELRVALTRFYVDRGYVTSGAVLPAQTVTDGILTFEIIEGTLTRIEVDNNKWFREGYIRKRLARGAQTPVNIQSLQQRLLLLEQDPRIERLKVELRPEEERGKSYLYAQVHETFPFYVALTFDNYQSSTVGAERGLISLAHRNVTGHGDILSVTYGRSEGVSILLDAGYTLPLNAYDTTVGLRYRRDNSVLVERPFADLDIESESEVFSLTLWQPLYRTLTQEFAVLFEGERLQNQTRLLDDPFDFTAGSEDGETVDTALRLTLEWRNQTQTQVVAIRSRFSLGIDALGATINDAPDVPDGRFFAWLGQFQWLRRVNVFSVREAQLLFRLTVQLANDPLLPLEQMAVGGRFTVRGYHENQLVRDNGLTLSLESRIPLFRDKPWADVVELAPFFDFGHAYNTAQPTPDLKTIYSIGIGLRWALSFPKPVPWRSRFEIYWGHALVDVDNDGGGLQDKGIHLQFVLDTL